jgi:polysaccharide biosynthesis transport protein
VTFRQILNTIWLRRWIVVAVVALAMAVAGLIVVQDTPSYVSTATVRYSAAMTGDPAEGGIDAMPVDLDPETITSPTVLEPAAAIAGVPVDELIDQVEVAVEEGERADRMSVTVHGPTPAAAEVRANAVVEAYAQYLQGQLDSTLVTLNERKAVATEEAIGFQAQVTENFANAIAQSGLSNALATLASLNTQIETIQNAGPPLTVLKPATTGEREGTAPLTVLALALCAGLIAGLGLALVRDQLDNRLRGEHEVEALTGVPSLGELSLDRSAAREKTRLPAGNRERTALNEGLRALRTTLQVLLPTTGAVLVITSVEPRDGKTFMSANLAVAWSRTGKRVVLVGGDLRRQGLGDYFGDAAEGLGLSELLTSAAKTDTAPSAAAIEAHLVDSEFAGLRILPSGAEPFEPADLLAVEALGDIFAALREMSDIVVVDSPPSMALTDASLLAAHADGVVVLARVNRTDRGHLVETIETLRSNGVTLLGVVSNRSKRRLPKAYDAYYINVPRRRGKSARPATGGGRPSSAERGAGRVAKPAPATPAETARVEAEDFDVIEPVDAFDDQAQGDGPRHPSNPAPR